VRRRAKAKALPRARGIALALSLAAAAIAAPSPAAAARARASLPAIERQAMCVTCKVALNESSSPQANVERHYIRELIARGRDEAQIKRALVAQFGPTVLALPSAHGFDLTVYLVPAAVVAALLATVALLLPSWRRRGRSGGPAAPARLSAADAARLDADLARFD
jgi:cytochrome c-type biogenesis protein CcmH/NrfF